MQEKHAVTGAFGYSGKYIAEKLLGKGHEVITLTNAVNRQNPFAGQIKAFPFNFEHPDKLVDNLHGVTVLYNTYWVRFNHKRFTYAEAIKNTKILFAAAKVAGVKRIVHVSITNPSEDSPLEYFRGKAILEKELMNSGLSYAILRPTVLFGKENILINNIAWALRRLPVFGIFGDGEYHLQPIYVDDLASLAIDQGTKAENVIINAIGPETFTYRGLVELIGEGIGKRRCILSVPPFFGYWAGWLLGLLVNDVIITRDEIIGLMSELLYLESPSAGTTKLSAWVKANVESLVRTKIYKRAWEEKKQRFSIPLNYNFWNEGCTKTQHQRKGKCLALGHAID